MLYVFNHNLKPFVLIFGHALWHVDVGILDQV